MIKRRKALLDAQPLHAHVEGRHVEPLSACASGGVKGKATLRGVTPQTRPPALTPKGLAKVSLLQPLGAPLASRFLAPKEGAFAPGDTIMAPPNRRLDHHLGF